MSRTAIGASELLRLDVVSMHYGSGENSVTALSGVDLSVTKDSSQVLDTTFLRRIRKRSPTP